MCELTSIAAAVFFAFVWRRSGGRDKAARLAMLSFAGASLMWAVDCVAGALEGGPLLDFSREDAVLGAIVLASGSALYAAARVVYCFRRPASCASL